MGIWPLYGKFGNIGGHFGFMQIRDISAPRSLVNFWYVILGTLLKCIPPKKFLLQFVWGVPSIFTGLMVGAARTRGGECQDSGEGSCMQYLFLNSILHTHTDTQTHTHTSSITWEVSKKQLRGYRIKPLTFQRNSSAGRRRAAAAAAR